MFLPHRLGKSLWNESKSLWSYGAEVGLCDSYTIKKPGLPSVNNFHENYGICMNMEMAWTKATDVRKQECLCQRIPVCLKKREDYIEVGFSLFCFCTELLNIFYQVSDMMKSPVTVVGHDLIDTESRATSYFNTSGMRF